MANKTTANIMIIGRTGAGKSEFINYLVGDNVAKTGCGEPITQSFDEYYYTFRDGFRIRVFDSKGLEVDSFKETVDDIEVFVKQRCTSDNLSEWLHLVIYCIDSGSKRVEPVEINFIKQIQDLTQTKLVVVLTHSPEIPDNNLIDMEQRVKDELNDSVMLYLVNSKYKRKKNGEELKTFGRKRILDDLDEIVWDNITRRMIAEYAEKLRTGLSKIIFEIDKELCAKVDRGRWVDLVRNMFSTAKLEQSEKKLKAFVIERDEQFYKSQRALLEMYYAFKDCWGGRSGISFGVEPESIVDNVISLDSLYAVLRKSKFVSDRAKEINELPFIEKSIAILRSRIKIREEMKDHIHTYCLGMIDKIPSQEEIEKQYRYLLDETRSKYEKHTPVVYKYDKRAAE